mgnify:FL=1
MNSRLEHLKHLDWRRYLPSVMVLGVLGASALLGSRATPQLVFLVAAGLVGTISFIWLTRHIEWGLPALVLVTFLVPFGLGTGTQTSINMSILLILLLLGVWIGRMLVIERHVILAPSLANLPALLFMVVVLLSFFASSLPWIPEISARASTFSQIGGLLMLILPIGILLLVGNLLRKEIWLRVLVWFFLGLGSLYLVGCLLPGGTLITGLINFSSVRALFFVWMTALSGGMLLFNNGLKRRQRWLFAGLLTLPLVVSLGLMRANASNWVPSLIVLAVLFSIRWWRLGALFVLMGGASLVLRYAQIYQFLFRTEQYSAMTRAATWPIMAQLVKASPLLGLGPSNYYFYTSHFSLLGYYVQFNSHNNYWDLAAQVGLLGLGLFLWLAFALGRIAWRLRSRALPGFQRGYVYAALAGLVGTLAAGMLADWFMPFTYNIGFEGFRSAVFAWLFLGGLIALERINAQGEN